MNAVEKVDQQKTEKREKGYVTYWKEKRKTLENHGIKIKVRHERLFVKDMIINTVVKETGQVLDEMVFVDEKIMTKGVRKFAGQTTEEAAAKLLPANPEFVGYEISNSGGQTTVSLFDGDKQVGTGLAKVHPNDHFIRYQGLTRALSRAISDMKNYAVPAL